MLENTRNKYLYNKTQIIELNKQGIVLNSDNQLYNIETQTSIAYFHPFFETIISLIEHENQEYTFSCIHLDINSESKTFDIIFNSGSREINPLLIFFDFT